MLIKADLVKIKVFNRKKFKTKGLVFEFVDLEKNKIYPRTFNLPENPNDLTKINKFLKDIGISRKFIDTNDLLTYLNDELLNKSFVIKLEESGKSNFPWNITSASML